MGAIDGIVAPPIPALMFAEIWVIHPNALTALQPDCLLLSHLALFHLQNPLIAAT
jgi:hypothetical protein